MRWLASLLLVLTLAGCSTVEFDELASGVAGTVGCGAGYALGNFGACVALGGAATVGTAVVTEKSAGPIDVKDYGGADGEINTIYELLTFAWAEFSQHLIGLGVVAGVFFLLSMWLGIRMPRGEERAMRKQQDMLVSKIAKMKE